MKLIIDIDKEIYENMKNVRYIGSEKGLVEVIKNGTPLETEFEKIKEEIHSEAYCERTFGPTIEKPRVVRLNKIDEIIDNHIEELKGE